MTALRRGETESLILPLSSASTWLGGGKPSKPWRRSKQAERKIRGWRATLSNPMGMKALADSR